MIKESHQDGIRTVSCPCGWTRQTDLPIDRLHHKCQYQLPTNGPGTQLKTILKQLGAKPSARCKCKGMIRRMNRWMAAGCMENRAEIVAHLQAAYSGLTWMEVQKAKLKAVLTGLAFVIDPKDICGSLVDEAIRRSLAPPGD